MAPSPFRSTFPFSSTSLVCFAAEEPDPPLFAGAEGQECGVDRFAAVYAQGSTLHAEAVGQVSEGPPGYEVLRLHASL